MHLAVADTLLPPGHLDQLLVELRLPLRDALLDLRHLDTPVADLALHVGAQLDGVFARLHEGLAPDRLRLALGIRDEPAPLFLAATESGRARARNQAADDGPSDAESDSSAMTVSISTPRGPVCPRRSRGCSHPVPRPGRPGPAAAWL